jgi:(1->4)-alpha-D-glucan 1-alpha-D-glucosylmutase
VPPENPNNPVSRIPVATYRLQLHAGFDFDAAAAIADYLRQLGISHVYSSPYLQAAPGSLHGYDVVDHHSVNQELGGAAAHARFCRQLGDCGLGQVLDIVPNHMAIAGRHNQYWWDVLENGPSSRYASYFDIDWQPLEEKLWNKLLVPILGDHYGRVLSRHEISVSRNGGEFLINYFDHHLPVAPKSFPPLLSAAAHEIQSDYLAFLADSYARLPDPTSTDRASVLARHRDKQVIGNLLTRLCSESEDVARALDNQIKRLNTNTDDLDDFLEHQNYRLAYWKTAGQELMYRRFFDVTTLVALRMESDHVFLDTHSLILEWLKEGVLDGIRIDHPDGLRDPEHYFKRLRDAASGVWIVAEKILEAGERLPESWPIDGTTGYEFLNQAGGLFIDPAGLQKLTDVDTEFTGESIDYSALCRDKKELVMRSILGSDLNRLTSLFVQVCESHRDRRDYTRQEIGRAIREIAAYFPVYRTYVVAQSGEVTDSDIHYIEEAAESAKLQRGEIDPELFDFIRDVLTLRIRGSIENEFVMRFQQFTSPVMAKGVEDTVFYCFNRLTSANEVGGNPGNPAVSLEQFHDFCADLQATRPNTMLTTSTHDTKRSEDVRARIVLLSEIPEAWSEAVRRWSAMNEAFHSGGMPDRNMEYLLYQTMVGAWPISAERLQQYMEKASREAKQQTSWISPNDEFERALREFIAKALNNDEFQNDMKQFVEPLIKPARVTSLSQTLLKLTCPGVPDIYQGMELWDLSLVDPDNRRPVDYDLRRRLLNEIDRLTAQQILEREEEGLPKMWVISQALKTRRMCPHAFTNSGDYRPLEACGSAARNIVAYERGGDVVVIVPRLVLSLGNSWGSTTLEIPQGKWKNQLTRTAVSGGEVKLEDTLSEFPVALLIREH